MDVVGALALPLLFSCFLLFYDWRMALILLAPVPVAILAAVITRMIILRTGTKHISSVESSGPGSMNPGNDGRARVMHMRSRRTEGNPPSADCV